MTIAKKIYELWDRDEMYLLGTFLTRDEALADVIDTAQSSGQDPHVVDSLRLIYCTPDSSWAETVADGRDLVALAHSEAPSIPRR